MSLLDHEGHTMTPTEAARMILISQAQGARLWEEQDHFQPEKLTDADRRLLNEALERQFIRLQKFFGHSGWKFLLQGGGET